MLQDADAGVADSGGAAAVGSLTANSHKEPICRKPAAAFNHPSTQS